MNSSKEVIEILNILKIPFETLKHPPVLTTDEADKYIEGYKCIRTKSLFLTNKKKSSYYLVILDDNKHLNMHKFQEVTGAKRLKFASPDDLMRKMGLVAGTVSIFGILNNYEKDIKIFFDQDIIGSKPLSFHPNTNEETIFISMQDTLKFIRSFGFGFKIINI